MSSAKARFKFAAKKTISANAAEAAAAGLVSPGGTKKRMHFFDAAVVAMQQKKVLQKWGQSFTVQHDQFLHAFERLDRSECNNINSMQFERACKHISNDGLIVECGPHALFRSVFVRDGHQNVNARYLPLATCGCIMQHWLQHATLVATCSIGCNMKVPASSPPQ